MCLRYGATQSLVFWTINCNVNFSTVLHYSNCERQSCIALVVARALAVGVTAAREAGLFRGLEADDTGADADMDFDGVWPGCALTVVCDAHALLPF